MHMHSERTALKWLGIRSPTTPTTTGGGAMRPTGGGGGRKGWSIYIYIYYCY